MSADHHDLGHASLGQIAIRVRDVERATAFYRDVLGLRFLFSAPGLSFFDASGVRLMLAVSESSEQDHPASILYYRVDDLEATFDTLRERGAPPIHDPQVVHRDPAHDLWMGFVGDSEGNTIGLMSERPRE